MDIKSLSVSNFRNLGQIKEVELPAGGLLVAAAPNAMGKTNFLESVAVLLRGKSWRARTEECVAWGEDSFLLRGVVQRGDGERQVAVRYHRPSRRLRIEENGGPVSAVMFYSHYPLVMFLPEDTFLFSRGPGTRRNFLNQVLVAHPQYLSALVQYYRVLKQRNKALKGAGNADDLQSWTGLLVDQAEVLWRYRQGLMVVIEAQLSEMYGRLSGETRRFRARLAPGVSRVEDFANELAAVFSQERRLGYTLYGPHRDDMVISADEHLVGVSSSAGQMRSLAVTLKLIVHHYLTQVGGEEPVLLLDDVLSELDERRQRTLIDNLPATQTILTGTTVPAGVKGRSDTYFLDLRAILKNKEENSVVEGKQKEKPFERHEVGLAMAQ